MRCPGIAAFDVSFGAAICQQNGLAGEFWCHSLLVANGTTRRHSIGPARQLSQASLLWED